MEQLPELTINLEVQLQEINYLEETMAFQINQNKFDENYLLANENALAQAVLTSFQHRGYLCDQVYCLLNWNISGEYFGKSFCKAYLRGEVSDKIYTYQAAIDRKVVDSYANRDSKSFVLTFSYISNVQDPNDETFNYRLKQAFSKLRAAIAGYWKAEV